MTVRKPNESDIAYALRAAREFASGLSQYDGVVLPQAAFRQARDVIGIIGEAEGWHTNHKAEKAREVEEARRAGFHCATPTLCGSCGPDCGGRKKVVNLTHAGQLAGVLPPDPDHAKDCRCVVCTGNARPFQGAWGKLAPPIAVPKRPESTLNYGKELASREFRTIEELHECLTANAQRLQDPMIHFFTRGEQTASGLWQRVADNYPKAKLLGVTIVGFGLQVRPHDVDGTFQVLHRMGETLVPILDMPSSYGAAALSVPIHIDAEKGADKFVCRFTRRAHPEKSPDIVPTFIRATAKLECHYSQE